ncbi:MAG TPA: glycosyl hydrolase, partial [Edaphobacter sp.]
EAYGADWTPNLPAEFLKRRGYDLVPYLPALVTGGTPEAEKIRHDWGKTLTELVDENYLIQINTWAVAHHTKFRSQTYGDPAVTLSSQHLVSLPEGEGPQWRAFSTLRWATSANHILGNNVSSGETFTWLHSPVFRATPLDMKAEADIAFIMGENQIIGHGWPYSPPQVSEPGWSLYAAAVFNDHNPWHPVMYDVTRYIQRISFLLRQGQPANQVALLLPTDDAWASFSPGQVSVTGAMQHLIKPQLMSAILSAGYNIDFIDPDAINRLGIHYPILVIPPTDRIPLETLRKIQQYTTAGGKVISVGGAPSLNSEGKSTAEITTLSRQLFDTAKFTQIANESALADALHTAAKPDLRLIESSDPTHADKLGFIRRRLPNADIYFVANTSNQPIQQSIDFATKYLSGSTLDPDTGESANQIGNSHDVKLTLAPYESRAFIFDNSQSLESPQKSDAESQLADLSSGWKVTFTSTGISHIEPTLTDWTANPDTKFYSGEAVYTRDFILPSATRNPTYLQIEGGSPIPGNSSSPPEHGLPDQKITLPGPGMRAYYDPPIREAAVVVINGQLAGSLWHPPYRLKVSPYLKPGQNHIEIHIYNTAINAWAAQPPRDYKPLIEKFGDRFQMQDLDKVRPIPSGLLGTVHLIVRSNE